MYNASCISRNQNYKYRLPGKENNTETAVNLIDLF